MYIFIGWGRFQDVPDPDSGVASEELSECICGGTHVALVFGGRGKRRKQSKGEGQKYSGSSKYAVNERWRWILQHVL